MKTCRKCGIEKSKDEFTIEKSKKDGLSSWCRECKKSYLLNYHRNYHPKKEKAIIGKYGKYGISEKDYLEMYQDQNGCCAICGKHKDVLDIDHNHETGEVRALLCGPCNRALGLMKDDPSILRRAASYLIDSIVWRQANDVLANRSPFVCVENVSKL